MFMRRFGHPLGSAVCVLAVMLVAATSQAQNARAREVSGIITDVDGTPVANVTVAVSGGGPTTTTGADGAFKLMVPAANLTLDVSAEGFTSRQVRVTPAGTPLQLQLTLVKTGPPAAAPVDTRMIGGVVSDAGHAPIAGATVRVRGTQVQAQTAADGSFTLPGVAVAEVVLDVEAANQPPTSVTVPADKAGVAITIGATAPVAAATTRTIRGKVLDQKSKEPVIGAQVEVIGSTIVALTDETGAFVIEGAPLGPVQLKIGAAEHENSTLDVPASQATVDVALGQAQGEVINVEGRAPVIVKTNLANGASVISDKDLNRVSAETLDTAMTAKLPGANLQANSGAPGGGAQLRLRGISTINGQSSPLYVIDGVVISNVSVPSGINAITGAAAGGSSSNQDNPVNRLSDLNPNDIETLEVLKGASAAALYGSKASNGVVVITTKRGRNGENHANVTQRVGISQVSNKLGSRHFENVEDVIATFGANNRRVQLFMNAGGKTFDHEAELTRTAFQRETLGSVSGGTDNGNYYGSVLVTDDPGVVRGTFYEKQTGRIAVGYKFGDRIHLGTTANVIHSLSDRGLTNNDNTGTSNYVVLAATPNFVDLQPKDGVYPVNPVVGAGTNPLQTVALLTNREDVWRIIGGTTLSIDAYGTRTSANQVTVLGNLGVDSFEQKNNVFSPNALIFESSDGLTGTSIDATTTNLNWNTGAGVVWRFKPDSGAFHSALSGGITYESVDLNTVSVVAQNLAAGQSNVDDSATVNRTQNRLRTKDSGLYAQEEIAVLDDRLSLLGGLLAERSSLNGNTDKYFVYPKAAAVYSVLGPSQAKNHGALGIFETLRVRAAYGEAGNRPNYGQKFTPLNATTNIDGKPSLVIASPSTAGSIGDPNIEPERQREFEIGTDVALKDQRVVVELTGYQRSISNLLLQRALPTSTGFNTQFLNGGSLRNRGIEAAVQARPLSIVDWTTRATLTLNRSMITSLPANVPAFDITVAGFGADLGAFRIEQGQSATQIVAPVNGEITKVGDGEPDFRVGWSNVVTAGDFTFSALLDWQQGSNVINLTRFLYDGARNSPDVEGAAARAAALDAGNYPYVEDASFVKLREVSVSYDLPKRLAAQLGPLKSLQLSLTGRNLLTFTHYSGLDPEVSNFGGQPIGRNYDVAPYPPSRSFWLSVSAGL
jgi:TonB-linked SusC/RagA family outer membrane protein